MAITDDLQRPSMDMSKIIVAMGIGLFSLLILNIFDLLSFWTLVVVLVGVAMVLKFGAPSVGTVVAIVVIFSVILWLGSVDWQKVADGDVDVYRPQSGNGLQGWQAKGEAVNRSNNYFELSPGAEMSKTFRINGISVRAIDVQAAPSSSLIIEIEDLDGYGHSAFFKFLIKDEMDVSFLECRGCCGVVSNFELSHITNDFSSVTSEINWNCVTRSVVGRGISYSLGNNDRIKYYSIHFSKNLWRDEKINYKVTIKNEGSSSVKIGSIEIK